MRAIAMIQDTPSVTLMAKRYNRKLVTFWNICSFDAADGSIVMNQKTVHTPGGFGGARCRVRPGGIGIAWLNQSINRLDAPVLAAREGVTDKVIRQKRTAATDC